MPTWTAMNDLETGDLVTEADMDALRGNIEYLLNPNAVRAMSTAGDYTTTSTGFVDVDGAGTGTEVTLTTHGGPVLILVSGHVQQSQPGNVYLDVAVDGVRLGQAMGLVRVTSTGPGIYANASFCALALALAAGTHTFKLQWATNGSANVATFFASASTTPAAITAVEL